VRNEEAANLETVRRLIVEGFDGGNLAVVDEVCAPDFVEHQHGIEPPTREGLKRAIAFLHRLAPDLRITLEESSVDGDRVWVRLRGRGTHGGAIMGGPTGRAFEITVMDLCRLRQGKIVEHWGVADRLAQMQQLGLIPAGGPGASPAPAEAGAGR
jgi:predicted ester cyclase